MQLTSTKVSQDVLKGVGIACLVILSWAVMLVVNFTVPVDWRDPLIYVRIFIQMHLFTGLFITAHDAMHGAVAPGNSRLNHAIGKVCAFLFLFNSYKKMRPKHYAHHKYAGTSQDPDFHKGHPNFFRWYFDFLKEYISLRQIVLAAITFNLLKLIFPEVNLILYWVLPSILSTFQLFYFGTFVPHKGEHAHNNLHHARTQSKNHVWAFLSCYFFGYHYEHHDSPMTPWWKLWKMK